MPFTITVLPVLLFSTVICAWVIDTSCQKYEPAISNAVTSAFGMASNAQTALSNPSANINTLAGYLFGANDNGHGLSVFNDLNTMGALGAGTNKQDPKQVVIYCDFSRLEERQINEQTKAVFDPDTNTLVAIDDSFNSCNTTSVTQISKTAAYSTGAVFDDMIMQVQLCPWYVASQAQSKRTLVKQLNLKGLANRILASGSDLITKISNLGSTMDTECLFDCTMLHELSHTRDGGRTNFAANLKDTYGWKNCVNLQSSNNADSIAFFALGVQEINNGNMPQQDGSLKSI